MQRAFSTRHLTPFLTVVSFLLCLHASSVVAAPPHPDAVTQWKAEGVWEQKVANWTKFKDANGCSPVEHAFEHFKETGLLTSKAVDTIHMLVICVDFPDYKYNSTSYAPGGGNPVLSSSVFAPTTSFDSLLFSRRGEPINNPTGSMTDFYFDNSYGGIVMTGDVKGWYTAPKNYSYYENNGDGLNGKSPELVRDAINAANAAGVSFSPYDNDGDNVIEFVIICHAGPGAETGAYGIWSHKFNVGHTSGGYFFDAYSINPEEQGGNVSNAGVYIHETGHLLGLPDLYDVSGQAQGIGSWSVMSGGSWNNNGRSPANFDAWCKASSNPIMLNPVTLTTNVGVTNIPASATTPFAILLRSASQPGLADFWMVENRQPIGNDVHLPGSGLAIYHIDPSAGNQSNWRRYLVTVEEADGLKNLTDTGGGGNSGDGGDLWPGTSNNRNFTDFSTPNSRSNNGTVTQIGIWNISNSGPEMTAEFDVVTYSRPYVKLFGADSILFRDQAPGGDGDGILEQGETVTFNLRVRNYARSCPKGNVVLTCDNPDIVLPTTPVLTSIALNPILTDGTNLSAPISFTIPADFDSRFVTFTALLSIDSLNVPSVWNLPFTTKKTIGRPQVLVVDDDNGHVTNGELKYVDALNKLGVPHVVWTKLSQGSPSASVLSNYKHIFWHGGGNLTNSFGTPTVTDIAALKTFMDNGGDVCISGDATIRILRDIDPAFVSGYLKATVDSTTSYRIFRGYPGSEIGNEIKFRFSSGPINGSHRKILPTIEGVPFLYLSENSGLVDTVIGPAAVSYKGTYRSVITSMMFPYVATNFAGYDPIDTILIRVLDFFRDNASTGVGDENDGSVLPGNFTLSQNYPNPFNPSTTIRYSIAANELGGGQDVRLSVFNVLGQEVQTLVDRPQGVGNYEITWDGKDQNGQAQASGVYFYRLVVGKSAESRKMMLLK